ncbi:MAG: hypothetical protein K8R39_07250 [Arcobacteraceae bacterium]|nr:hypothetical protein [Arcobacteraceae bacterium]
MKTKYFFLSILSFCFFQFAYAEENNVDCLILEDENSIICKYSFTRIDVEKNVLVQWIEPDNRVTREREILIPANHGSVYDYRYIEGRTKGVWTFKVIDNQKEHTTNFTIE